MSAHAYTEDHIVERPAIGLFAALGWQTVSAQEETFGPSPQPPLPFLAGFVVLCQLARGPSAPSDHEDPAAEKTMSKHYQGSCHCGSVRFSFESEIITKGLRCNCSICSRKGALMSPEPIPADRLKIEAREDVLGLYQCGIYTFHETSRKPGHFRVNLGCVEGVDPFSLETDVLDGKHLL